jgi:3-oxoacyl-[acyl-carrier protein] reductase
MVNLENRVAFVTGAAQGIGAATARRLARAGASVALIDLNDEKARDVAAGITEQGGKAVAIRCDVSARADVDRAVNSAIDQLGALDILVNNAGVLRDNLLFKMSDSDWDTVIGIHLTGSFLCSQAAQTTMVKNKWGRIVNVSSVAALGNRGQTNYSVAKAGLQGMTKTHALELGQFNITVNSVAPGFVDTDMVRATAERQGIDFETFRQAAADRNPMKRAAKPEDIANAIALLCSDDAGFINGQVVYVTGGPRT